MKLRWISICIVLVAVLLCGLLLPAGVALADSTPVLLLAGKTTEDEVVVEVTLRNNEGISAMSLTLDYDREKLVLVGLEQGEEALSTLELITTNPQGPDGYAADPFVFNWLGDANDNSNGKLLTLRFAPVSDNVDGKAYVTFSYVRNQDVNYVEKGNPYPQTRNLIVDTLHVDLSNGKAVEMENEIVDEIQEPNKDNTTAVAVGVSLSGVPIIVLAIGLPLLWRKKHI